MSYLLVCTLFSNLHLEFILLTVDAHTARHLYDECLKGELMEGRTVILVSHHIQMCAPGASYVVALDNGRVQFQGSRDDFYKSGVIRSLLQSSKDDAENGKIDTTPLDTDVKQENFEAEMEQSSESSSTVATSKHASVKQDKKPVRKLIEEEKRAVGRVSLDIWQTYIRACGNRWYWIFFSIVFLLASASPVLENGWLRYS